MFTLFKPEVEAKVTLAFRNDKGIMHIPEDTMS